MDAASSAGNISAELPAGHQAIGHGLSVAQLEGPFQAAFVLSELITMADDLTVGTCLA
jgi:hypothetical protein